MRSSFTQLWPRSPYVARANLVQAAASRCLTDLSVRYKCDTRSGYLLRRTHLLDARLLCRVCHFSSFIIYTQLSQKVHWSGQSLGFFWSILSDSCHDRYSVWLTARRNFRNDKQDKPQCPIWITWMTSSLVHSCVCDELTLQKQSTISVAWNNAWLLIVQTMIMHLVFGVVVVLLFQYGLLIIISPISGPNNVFSCCTV